jgi:hypothetical protein
MLQDQTKEYDPFDEATNPPEQTYDLFGKIEISAWACAFQKGVKGGVPYDPAVHEKRHTMIDIFIQPLPEINVKYPKTLEFHDVTWSVSWAKFTLPSIKALGIDNVKEINGKWARVARVPNGKQYAAKDTNGNPTGEMRDETTFKFIAFFADEDACRAAYLAAGGQTSANGNGHNIPTTEPITQENAERATAEAFLKVIVTNAARGASDYATAKEAVGKALAQYPTVAKFFNADSLETGALITETTGHLPF